MNSVVSDATRLYGDWLGLEWSKEKILIAAIALPVLLVGAANLPLILFALGLWVIYNYILSVIKLCATSLWAAVFRKIWTSSSGPKGKKNGFVGLLGNSDTAVNSIDTPIPGKKGLPFVGETVSYLSDPRRFLAEKRTVYGDVFAANLDFSGTFLAARRVVFMYHTSAVQTERSQGERAGSMVAHSPSRITAHSMVASAGSPQRRSPSKASMASPARATAMIPATLAASGATPVTAAGAGTPCAPQLGRKLHVLGYTGLYGTSCHGGDLHQRCLSILAERVLGQHRHLDAWEDTATPIVQAFLRRLIYESAAFSLADRVNELACELVGSLFLGIPGFSPSLLAALDGYLNTALHNPAFNASLAHRKQLNQFIHVAMFEEDKRFFARDWQEFDAESEYQSGEGGAREVGMLGEVMEICADILHEENSRDRAHSSDDAAAASRRDAMQQDLVFIFVVEVVYPTLLRQLRALAESITQDRTAAPDQQEAASGGKSGVVSAQKSVPAGPAACRESYAAYLSARQLVGNVSGSGLARFSWASTIYPEEGAELEDEGAGESEHGPPRPVPQIAAAANVNAHAQESATQPERAEIGGRSSIGSYLLSQLSWPLSWPLSPAATSAAQGIAAMHEPLQDYEPPSRTATSATSRATRNPPASVAAGRDGIALPVAQSCDAEHSASDSELAYSSSGASAGRPPAVHTAFLGHLSTAIVEPQSTPAVMQNTGRRGIPQVTPSAPQTPASSASWKRPSSSLSRSGTGGKARYDGRFGYRRTTPGKSLSSRGYSVVTPSRSVMRTRGDSVSGSSPGAFLRSPAVTTPHSVVSSGGRGKRSAVVMTPGSEAGSSAGTPNKTTWRYRERLIIRYVTSVKVLVAGCKESTRSDASQQPVNSTLSQCKQSFDVFYTPPADPTSAVQYTINKGDLVVRLFPRDTADATASTVTAAASADHPASVPASRDLGAFSDLVLAIFAHELVTGFEWDSADAASTTSSSRHSSAPAGLLKMPRSYQVLHREAPLSTAQAALQLAASIAATFMPPTSPPTATAADSRVAGDAGSQVKKFRVRPDNIAFLISTHHAGTGTEAEGSDGEGGEGTGGGRRALMRGWLDAEDEDERYYSDGL